MLLKFLLAELLTIAAEISSLFLVVRSTPLTSLIFSKGSDMKLKHSPMIPLDKWSHEVMPVFKQSSAGVLVKRYCRNMQQIYRRRSKPKCDFNKVAVQIRSFHWSVFSHIQSEHLVLSIFRHVLPCVGSI